MILPPIGRVLNRFAHITHSREEVMRFAEIHATKPEHVCFSFKVGDTPHAAAMRSMELMMGEVKPTGWTDGTALRPFQPDVLIARYRAVDYGEGVHRGMPCDRALTEEASGLELGKSRTCLIDEQ
jgi:hypothetical protein